MKILIPTDFSNTSKKAAKYAAHLAISLKAKLIVFHAIPQHSIWLEEDEKKILADCQKKLDHFVATLKKYSQGKVPLETLIVHRFPLNDVVNDLVKKMKIDFIVMGTKGVTGAVNKLMGGFASGMIRHSKVPVIAVPESSKCKTISSIVLPTDLINMADEIKTVVRFAKYFNADIHVLFVSKNGGKKSMPADLSKFTSYKNIYSYQLRGSEPEIVIEKFISDRKANMLAMFTRKRGFFKRLVDPSITESLSFNISVPLLAFKKE